MDRLCGDTIFDEELHDFIGPVFCPSEDECCFDGFRFEELEEEVRFIAFVYVVDLLSDDLCRRRYWSDCHSCRVMEYRARELHDLFWHRC